MQKNDYPSTYGFYFTICGIVLNHCALWLLILVLSDLLIPQEKGDDLSSQASLKNQAADWGIEDLTFEML